MNTTDSAVRITHIPTNIVVHARTNGRSTRTRSFVCAHCARGCEVELEKKRAETQSIEDSKLDIAWGSQIRSYVLQPYRLVKDHRTKVEVGDVDRVLDGDLRSSSKPTCKLGRSRRFLNEISLIISTLSREGNAEVEGSNFGAESNRLSHAPPRLRCPVRERRGSTPRVTSRFTRYPHRRKPSASHSEVIPGPGKLRRCCSASDRMRQFTRACIAAVRSRREHAAGFST